jgi:hypothetical protein
MNVNKGSGDVDKWLAHQDVMGPPLINISTNNRDQMLRWFKYTATNAFYMTDSGGDCSDD